MCACPCVAAYLCVCLCVCVCACTWVHTYICVCLRWAHVSCDVHVCACACARVHVCMCARVLERTIPLLLRVTPHPCPDTSNHQAESLWHSACTHSCSFWFLTLFPILWWHNHWWCVQIRGWGHQHLSTDVHNLSGVIFWPEALAVACSLAETLAPWRLCFNGSHPFQHPRPPPFTEQWQLENGQLKSRLFSLLFHCFTAFSLSTKESSRLKSSQMLPMTPSSSAQFSSAPSLTGS